MAIPSAIARATSKKVVCNAHTISQFHISLIQWGGAMNNPWYRRYPADFINGTFGMTLEEKGAYSLILDLIYARGGPLPDDARSIAGACGCSVRKWTAIRDRLISLGKITVRDGLISNSRADLELENSSKLARNLSENGAKGGNKSAEKRAEMKKINDLGEAPLKPRTRVRTEQNRTDKNHPSDGNAQARDPTPRELLLTVLSPETADAVIQHRRSKRAPLSTLLAARGLVNAFKEFPDGPEAAAALMVTSGWTGFKREFWDKRPAMGGQRRMTAAEETGQRLAQRIEEMNRAGRPDPSSEGSGDLWPSERLLAAGGQAHRPPLGQLR